MAMFFVGAIVVFPFLVPYHTPPAPSFYGEWLAFTLGVGACIVLLSPKIWHGIPVPRATLFPLLGVLAVIAAQSLVIDHVYPLQGLLPILYLIWACLLAVVVTWLKRNYGLEKTIIVLAWYTVVGGLLQAITGIIQYVNIYGWLEPWVFHKVGASIIGNAAQSNHLATHVTLAALSLTYLYARRQASSAFVFGVSLILATALTLSASRAVLLYLVASLFLSIYGLRVTREHGYLRCAWISSMFLVLIAIGQYASPILNESLRVWLGILGFELSDLEILTAFTKGTTAGIQDRLVEWHKAWLMFLQSPFTGIGAGHYGWYSFELHGNTGFDAARNGLFNHPHNLFMEILAELGLIGFVVVVIGLIVWFKQLFHKRITLEQWLIAGVLLILLIHSSLEYPLWYSYFLGIAVIFMALGDNRLLAVRFSPRLGQFGAAISLLLALAILTMTLDGYRRLSDIHINELVLRESPKHAASVLVAVSKNPLLTPWAEAAMVTHGRPDKSTIAQQLKVTTRLAQYNPSPVHIYHQIVYLAMGNKTEEAVALLRQAAVAYSPEFPKYICRLRQLPYEETIPLVQEGERLLGKPSVCLGQDTF